jgi:hypothetical protein
LPAIRELAARDDFRDDAAWIAKMLIPPITPAEARRALSRLMVRKMDNPAAPLVRASSLAP